MLKLNTNKAKKAALIIISLVVFGCSSMNLYTPGDDIKLGQQITAQIDSNPVDYPILDNSKATAYIQGIVNKILEAPEIQFRGVFAYKAKIINDDRVVNAFCTPGGFIYVYTGLLKMIDNEATLAAVLAHEIAHAERRHSTRRMTNALGLEMLAAVALGNESDETSKVVANLFTGMALLKNSRDDEYESDESSFLYLKSVNKWYPGAMKMFFDKMSDAPDDLGLKTILSTHPVGQDRIDAINAKLKQYNVKPPTEANLFVKKYREFVNTLQ